MHEEQRVFAAEIARLRNSGLLEEAKSLSQKAALQFPDSSFFHKLLGDIYRQTGQFQEASDEYLKMLTLIQPTQFQIFVKAYRNLEKSTSSDFMKSFEARIREVIEATELQDELKKDLNSLLGVDFVLDANFLDFAKLANDDKNLTVVKNEVNIWESRKDFTKIEALATYKLKEPNSPKSKRIDVFLIKKLDRIGNYDLALSLVEKTQKPYYNKSSIVRILKICRKKSDYAFAEKELTIDENFIESSDFNIQYELVYYFQTTDQNERLDKTLKHIRNSAESSIPIARTLYNFYLSLNRFEDAQDIYEHILQLEQQQEAKRNKGKGAKPSRSEEQSESEQAIWQRLKDLVSEQEHNRQMIALRDLLKGFSHELGQPITNIRYAIQYHKMKMRKGLDKPEDLETLLSGIISQTDRLGTLLARFSPVVSPKNESGIFSLKSCAEQVFADLESRLQSQNISYQIDGPSELVLTGDQVQFSQVFYNLILNSMQAVVKDGHIDISIIPSGNSITIEFTDNGPGIPKENRQKIFQPFFSTKDPTSGNGGEGLGLYIVWNILKMFNGTIHLDDAFQNGTRFIIQIHEQKGDRQK